MSRAFRFGALAVCLAAVPVAAAKRAGDDCAPLRGTWERSMPLADHWGETGQVLKVEAGTATMSTTRREYGDESNPVTAIYSYATGCRTTSADSIELTLTPSEPNAAPWVMAISRLTADSFVTMEFEPPPHPPPEDWKGAEWAIVWKRIAP